MTMDLNFSWNFKDFAIRNYRNFKSEINTYYPIELVKYTDREHKHCYTVAMWWRDEEGYELHFVGSRPFDDISPDEIKTIWRQLQAAQKMLDEYFNATEGDA